MTPRSEQPKEHCEHECVCEDYHIVMDDEDPKRCNIAKCPHDTRPHPAPSLCESTHIPTQEEFIAEFVGNEQRKRDEHDAALTRKAREELQQRIDEVIEILELQIGCSMMLSDDGDNWSAYDELQKEAKRAIALLQAGDP